MRPSTYTADMAEVKGNQQRMLQLLQSGYNKTSVSVDRTSSTAACNYAMLVCARDIDAMIEATDDQLYIAATNVLACRTCLPDVSTSTQDTSQNVPGRFSYNMSVGTSFSKPEQLPREFVSLKNVIRQHFSGGMHTRKAEAKMKEQQDLQARLKAAGTISTRVLRTAYVVLKKSHSREQFEDLLVLQHENGLNVGDLCHSGSQMTRFRDAFGTAVLDSVRRHVEQAPCVSWVADKVTLNGRTIDITAVITIFPEADDNEMIQSVVVGAPIVTQHDGSSLAREWVQTAERIGITDTKKVAAICTDGQYHHQQVPAKFLSELAAVHPDIAQRSVPPAVPYVWDGSHLSNLADGATRQQAECAWVDATVEVISRITKRFAMGKARERLRTISEQNDSPLRGLQLWSETRFAPHAASVLNNFLDNMRAMAAAMGEMLDAPSTKTSAIPDLEADLRLLTGKIHFLPMSLT